MNKEFHNISYLRRYVKGELSSREMFEIERASHADEMLMDIILGLEMEENLAKKRLNTQKNKVLGLSKKWLGMAASLLLAFVAGSIYMIRLNGISQPSTEVEKATNNLSSTESAKKVPYSDDLQQQDYDHSGVNSKEDLPLALEKPAALARPRVNHKTPKKFPAAPNRRDETIIVYIPAQKGVGGNAIWNRNNRIFDNETTEEETLETSKSTDAGQSLVAANTKSILIASNASPKNKTVQDVTSAAQLRAKLTSMNLDPQTSMMLGRVIDEQSREPLAGVKVKDLDSKQIVTTDSTGRFAYASKIKSNLEIKAPGYKTREIGTTIGEQTISLNPSNGEAFDELSIKANESKNSEPLLGWKRYKNYLDTEFAKVAAADISFMVQFELDNTGTPTKIKFTRSSHTTLNGQFRKIIEQGPKWHLGIDRKNITYQY